MDSPTIHVNCRNVRIPIQWPTVEQKTGSITENHFISKNRKSIHHKLLENLRRREKPAHRWVGRNEQQIVFLIDTVTT